MKMLEKCSRYFLGIWFMICAVDGWGYLLFGAHLTGEHTGVFLSGLVSTTWFWAFLKLVQSAGSISLLANYKPAFGLALTVPISAVMCLFYVFELVTFIPIAVLIIASTVVLFRAYAGSYRALFDSAPGRGRPVASDEGLERQPHGTS